MTAEDDYWNHNVHYQRVILRAVPAGCGAALDVGCGDGMLVCKLASRCESVTGIDRDAQMIALACARAGGRTGGSSAEDRAAGRAGARSSAAVALIEDDFLQYPFKDDSFDFVCSNTVLHHMGTVAALRKMARVLRPGGRLAVIGLGEYGSRVDHLPDIAAIPVNRYYQRTRGEVDPGCPKMGPDMTWSQVREAARWILPGVRYRRHLLWRYSLIWDKPA